MIGKIINELKNQKILILGLGLEGISTYNLLKKYDNSLDVYLADANIYEIVQNQKIEISELNLISDMNYVKLLAEYDVIFKTPGISFVNYDVDKYINKITSQLDMFFKYSNHKSVGITGTKGKSTTTSLLYTIIKNEIDNTIIAGNIGIPIFDQLENIDDDTIVIIELSSHQLQYINYSPYIAVILNFYEEHLDHYGTYEKYILSKLRVVKDDNHNEYFIYDKSIDDICKDKTTKTKIVIDFNNIDVFEGYNFNLETKLLGEHNKKNIFYVLNILKVMNLDLKKITKSIVEFKPLEHRLELVGEYNDIIFYNDSISTIPETTISCLESINGVTSLILGGMDRKVDYQSLVDYINYSDLKYVVCLKETGHKLAPLFNKETILVESLEEAVKVVYDLGSKQVCALSPGAASYNQFKNFIERGNKYKEYIYKYCKKSVRS